MSQPAPDPPSSSELRSKIERAYLEGWERVNLADGWHLDKACTLTCSAVDKVEGRWMEDGKQKRKVSGMAEKGDLLLNGLFILKAFRVTASLPCKLEKAAALLRDVNRAANWNKTLQVAIDDNNNKIPFPEANDVVIGSRRNEKKSCRRGSFFSFRYYSPEIHSACCFITLYSTRTAAGMGFVVAGEKGGGSL